MQENCICIWVNTHYYENQMQNVSNFLIFLFNIVLEIQFLGQQFGTSAVGCHSKNKYILRELILSNLRSLLTEANIFWFWFKLMDDT